MLSLIVNHRNQAGIRVETRDFETLDSALLWVIIIPHPPGWGVAKEPIGHPSRRLRRSRKSLIKLDQPLSTRSWRRRGWIWRIPTTGPDSFFDG